MIVATFLLGYLKFGLGVLNVPGKVMNIVTGVLLVVAVSLSRLVDSATSGIGRDHEDTSTTERDT